MISSVNIYQRGFVAYFTPQLLDKLLCKSNKFVVYTGSHIMYLEAKDGYFDGGPTKLSNCSPDGA